VRIFWRSLELHNAEQRQRLADHWAINYGDGCFFSAAE